MKSMKKQAAAGLIGMGLGMVLSFGFSAWPLNQINSWLWLVPLVIGIVLYVKS